MPPLTLESRLVQSARALLMAAMLMATAAHGAHAQQVARVRVAVDVAPRAAELPRNTSLRPLPVAPDSGEHSSPKVHGAKVGALIGVAAGLVYTLALNTKKSCTEKTQLVCTEDEHDYRTFTYPIFGGLIGAVVGAVVGSARE